MLSDTLMTLEEVAGYLRLSKDTVYRMTRAGKIPASRAGNQWRFWRKDVDAWLQRNRNSEGGAGGGHAILELLRKKREAILEIAARHGARNVRVFGSSARGEADEESDIDLLVDLEPERSLLDHAALWLELQDVLGRRVDVVSGRGIKPRIRDRVLEEALPL